MNASSDVFVLLLNFSITFAEISRTSFNVTVSWTLDILCFLVCHADNENLITNTLSYHRIMYKYNTSACLQTEIREVTTTFHLNKQKPNEFCGHSLDICDHDNFVTIVLILYCGITFQFRHLSKSLEALNKHHRQHVIHESFLWQKRDTFDTMNWCMTKLLVYKSYRNSTAPLSVMFFFFFYEIKNC